MEFAAQVELYLTYLVYCASWKPTYDIRASTTKEGEQSVKLCYYGLVEQNTGDDWKDTELVLSTASPSIGGSPPHLATLTASLHRSSRYNRQRHASAARRKPMSAASEEDMGFGSFDLNDIVDAAAMHRYNHGQMSRSSEDSTSNPCMENIVSACFSIPRTVSISTNGHEQKVLIAMVDLASAFFHETVPSRSCSAFLSASITNTSAYPILPGPASIYLNDSFVSRTHLRLVAPGEEFRCALGMDPSIKVEYKTPKSYQEQVGLISKSTVVTHEKLISLRNAKVSAQAVQITVKEQIPKSTDEKIKVCILAPDIRTKGTDARLNKDHNLEWSLILAAGQQKDLLVKYTVEHPASESVSFF
ncbi:unnamed protein product [Auanema sp. JU1783]|nr:unnamed protein product [Auanema sp. JU1783]